MHYFAIITVLFPLTQFLFILNLYSCLQLLKAPKDEHTRRILAQVQAGNANQGYIRDLQNYLRALVNKDGLVRKAFQVVIPSDHTFGQHFGELSPHDQAIGSSGKSRLGV
jgi:hypothetical protein